MLKIDRESVRDRERECEWERERKKERERVRERYREGDFLFNFADDVKHFFCSYLLNF